MLLRASTVNALVHLSSCPNGGCSMPETRAFVHVGSYNPESPIRLNLSGLAPLHCPAIKLHCFKPDSERNAVAGSTERGNGDLGSNEPSSGNNGGGDDGISTGGGGGGGDEDEYEEREFGPLLKFEDVMKEAEAKGVSLPSDIVEAAKSTGIRELFLSHYLELQVIST
ncbi:hypothetical protein SLA2020_522180 [Shorea laevis]